MTGGRRCCFCTFMSTFLQSCSEGHFKLVESKPQAHVCHTFTCTCCSCVSVEQQGALEAWPACFSTAGGNIHLVTRECSEDTLDMHEGKRGSKPVYISTPLIYSPAMIISCLGASDGFGTVRKSHQTSSRSTLPPANQQLPLFERSIKAACGDKLLHQCK